ncbi:hypothetical protein GUITHDRAFT_162044 [Guillardia theta CCMP2712]|uniref:DEAD box protein 1 n=1 Tax=Guillardia theta (strain CCMP2712) TaxID=905079 RepID=L1JMS2_GUITC|nr:hypothetical protein GUITHDRAFT_162044 [Guillardia theta CCMP2712]EKX49574.1 hypothetical protein GUITHDRAFT_162044 [Guillardia theta CCMP2712]|eukprot:XP_005836554.1 hypothetical protein GUITHDRAFT_162044 [Guillardia theta CCMP2712]
MAAFAELGVMGEIIRSIDEEGWQLPTPIQQEAIPLILGGGDVLGAAETGTGKTGAFGIPILQLVHENLQNQASSDTKTHGAGQQKAASEFKAAMSAEGLVCVGSSKSGWCGGRANIAVKKGKYMYEVEVQSPGLARVGFSTMAANRDLGKCANGFGYGGTGKRVNNNKFEDFGLPFGDGDVVGCCIDMAGGDVAFFKNGEDLGVAFSLPPHLRGKALYPTVCLKDCQVRLNLGSAAFRFPVGGLQGICQAPAEDTVKVAGEQSSDVSGSTPLAVILEPARDLAEQTFNCMMDYSKYMVDPKIHCLLSVGGTEIRDQAKALKDGVHVVVGTPGRIEDLMKTGKLSCQRIRHFVLDEADRLLETGNLPTIMSIFSRLNKDRAGENRLQTLMFSATLHSAEIKSLAAKICQYPIWVDLKGKDSVPESVYHLVYDIDPTRDTSWGKNDKYPTDEVHLAELRKGTIDRGPIEIDSDMRAGMINPSNPHPLSRSEGIKRLKLAALVKLVDNLKASLVVVVVVVVVGKETTMMDHCLIFCRTNFDCDNLERHLVSLGGGRKFHGKAEKGKENPYSCVVLAGWRSVEERRQNLQAFKDGDVRFLIATDVAARGIDISGLPYVVNMTLPDVAANYIHRIGRVGRADKMGLAISFVATEKERVWFCQKNVKGRGPGGRAPPCDDTRDYEVGGNCIWYDEPAILREIEVLLGKSIEKMPVDMKLNPALLQIKFGESKDDGTTQRVSAHLDQLRPVIQKLTAVESTVQSSFLKLRARFNKARDK